MHTSSKVTNGFQWTLILGILLALMGAPELSAQSTLGSDPVFELGDGLEPPGQGIADILGSEQPGPDWDDLFTADGTWRDDFDEFGNPGSNGVPDFLDTWGVFRTRRDVVFVQDSISAGAEVDSTALIDGGIGEAIVSSEHDVGNAYAYTAFNNDLDFVLYIGAERLATASGTSSFMLFEFSQVGNGPSVGDVQVRANFDGFLRSIEVATFQLIDEEAAGPVSDWVVIESIPVIPEDPAEQCNLAGSACAVCNGITVDGGSWANFDESGQETTVLAPDTFLEVGLNLSRLVGIGLDFRFSELTIVTPEDVAVGSFVRAVHLEAESTSLKMLKLETEPEPPVKNPEGPCMAENSGFGLNCTANDIQIAGIVNDSVEITDPCDFPGDTALINFEAEVVMTANEDRHDIGVYISRDGGDAQTGSCFIGALDYQPSPPFVDSDGTGDDPNGELQDICGDIDNTYRVQDPPVPPLIQPFTDVAISCVDTDGDGIVDVNACLSWRIPGKNDLCRDYQDVIPANASKCRCQPMPDLEVPVPKTLQVIKDLDPDDDSGRFNLLIDSAVEATEVGEGGMTEKVAVEPGVHQVSEVAFNESTDLDDYATAVSCVDRVGVCQDNSTILCTSDANCVAANAGEICDLTPRPVTATPSSCTDCVSWDVTVLEVMTDMECTITNTLQTGTLRVIKEVINDNGGDAVPGDFELHVKQDGTGVTDSPQPGSTDGYVYTLLVGEYVVSESDDPFPDGYTETGFSGDCDDNGNITVVAGDEVTCTITNDDNPPQLTLVKEVVNNEGGDNKADEWTLEASGDGGFSGAGTQNANPAVNDATLGPNDVKANVLYTLSESGGPDGYEADDTWSCVVDGGDPAEVSTITLTEGQIAVCTIQNDDIPPELTLVKEVVNDDGGDNLASEWTLAASGDGGFNGAGTQNANPAVNDATLGPNDVKANVLYTLSESGGPDGYDESTWSCVIDGGGPAVVTAITLTEGQTAVCTITNDDKAPTLTLVKTVTNDNGGKLTQANFPSFVDSVSQAWDVATEVTANEEHTASETEHPGYTASVWGGDCASDGTITLLPGDNKTCTITNDDKAPTLTLVKTVIGGLLEQGDFPSFLDGSPLAWDTQVDVTANEAHTASETEHDDYIASVWGDDCATDGTITLLPGDNKTCTITNTRKQGHIELIKIWDGPNPGNTIIRIGTNPGDADIASANAFGESATTSRLPVDTGMYFMSETNPGPNFDGIFECADRGGNPVTVGENNSVWVEWEDDVVCTIRNVQRGNYIIVKKFIGGDDTATFDPSNTEPFALTTSGGPASNTEAGGNLPPAVYTVTEGLVYGWALASIQCNDSNSTGNLTERTANINVDAGETVTCTFTNLPAMMVTDSALCVFDVDEDDSNGRQWRRILTQDVQQWPNFKFGATNPGQFFYNLGVNGDEGNEVTLTLNLPWPFVTQGAQALHAWDAVTFYENDAGQTCYCPGFESVDEITGECTPAEPVAACDFEITLADYTSDVINPSGDRSGYTEALDGSWSADSKAFVVSEHTTDCTITIPASGFLYINQHLDDGLKGPHVDIDAGSGDPDEDGVDDRYAKYLDDDAVDPATLSDTDPTILMPELADHDFSMSATVNGDPPQEGDDTVQNDNEFKKNPGVAGRVTLGTTASGAPVEVSDAVQIDLWNPAGDHVGSCDGKVGKKGEDTGESECFGFDLTDSDAWWQIIYKHKGKPAMFTIDVSFPTSYDNCYADEAVWSCTIDSVISKWVCTKQEHLKGNEFSEVNLELFEDDTMTSACAP